MHPTLEELKDRISIGLDITEIMDILDVSERELLDYLDDLINEHREDFLSCLK